MADEAKTTEKDQEERPDDLQELLEQLGGADQVRITVYRYDDRNQRDYLETIHPHPGVDLLEDLQARFGGGKYFLQFRKDRKIRANETVRIAGAPKPHPSLAGKDDGEDVEPEDEVARLRRELEERTEELRQRETRDLIKGLADRVEALAADVRRPPPDAERQNPMELAISLVGAFQTSTQPYLQALLERPSSEVSPEVMMDLFFRGIEAADRMKSGNEYLSVVREFKPLMSRLLDGAHGSGGPIGADGAPMTATQPAPLWHQVFGPYVGEMVKWASLGLNPELRAALVLEELPEEYVDVVGEAVHRDGFVEEFVQAVPQAEPHSSWFRIFFSGLQEGIELEPEADDVGGRTEVPTPDRGEDAEE